jgi:tetratricopeptide (TPR) repeat protein
MYLNMPKYSKAPSSHEKALDTNEKGVLPNHAFLATSYNNIGGVYDNIRDYSKALSFYEKALDTNEKGVLPNHALLATS